jgi:hypothetical protein
MNTVHNEQKYRGVKEGIAEKRVTRLEPDE